MQLTSFYPVLSSDDVAATKAFYTTYLGFSVTFEADWYVSLRQSVEPFYELAIIARDHETMPEGYRRPVSGLILNFEVADVDAEYVRLVEQGGLDALVPLRSEAFGQRHFIVTDPNGVMIDVIKVIPPSPEYAAQFTSGDGE
jgi:catechol 2,3-dioxygenase-like lactoylglutathione lyase family enzyme